MQSLHLKPAGLVTDPSPFGDAPDGALSKAQNVVIQRRGLVEPRPGFPSGGLYHDVDANGVEGSSTYTGTGSGTGYYCIAMHAYKDDLITVTTNGTLYHTWSVLNEATILDEDGNALTYDPERIRFAEAAGNLYITCADGVRRISDPSDTTAYLSGLARPPNPSANHATYANQQAIVAADTSVAYRTVIKRVVNGREIRSAPSPRIIQRSNSGESAETMKLDLFIPHDALVGDVVEVYRSRFATSSSYATPSDEMRLVKKHIIVADDFDFGYTSSSSIYDTADDENVTGAALYTNSTQEGGLQENGRPPYSRDVAEYSGMMFFAGATWPHRIKVAVHKFAGTDDYSDRFNEPYTIAGDTAGSTTVSNVSAADIAKLSVGQAVYDSGSHPLSTGGSNFSAHTIITAIGASSFTISQAALSSSSAITIGVSDWMEVDGVRIYSASIGTYEQGSITSIIDEWTDTEAGHQGPSAISYRLRTYSADQDATFRVAAWAYGDENYDSIPVTFLFEKRLVTDSSFTFAMTSSQASDLDLDPTDYTDTVTSTQPGGPAYLAWSKVEQPEHVPPVNYVLIGSENHPIERIIPTRDSLFVFKTDGVWRVSGPTPQTIRLDEFDRTMRLVHPSAVAPFQGRIAAWTNKGVVLISEGGVINISDAAIAHTLDPSATDMLGQNTLGAYMAAHDDEDLLILGVPTLTAGVSPGYSEVLYVYCARSGAWVTWTGHRTLCGARLGSSLYLGGEDSSSTPKIFKQNDYGFDLADNDTVSTVTNQTVTISGTTSQVVGSILEDSAGDYFYIESFESSSVFTVAGNTSPATGACVIYSMSVDRKLTWRRKSEATGPSMRKFWREQSSVFESKRGLGSIQLDYTTDSYTTEGGALTVSADYDDSAEEPASLRSFVPRDYSRSFMLDPSITFRGARGRWAFAGVALTYNPMTERD